MKGKNFDPRNNKAHNGARSLENVNNFVPEKGMVIWSLLPLLIWSYFLLWRLCWKMLIAMLHKTTPELYVLSLTMRFLSVINLLYLAHSSLPSLELTFYFIPILTLPCHNFFVIKQRVSNICWGSILTPERCVNGAGHRSWRTFGMRYHLNHPRKRRALIYSRDVCSESQSGESSG